MKRFLIVILFLSSQSAKAYNPFWVAIDKRLINNIIQLDRSNPQLVEQYFKTQKIQKCDTTIENLGFGWKMWTPGIGGGYISISATFYYFNDSIVSYSIIPRMPDEKGLIPKYKKWYQTAFMFVGQQVLPYNFNENALLKPLTNYKGTLTIDSVPKRILEYMAPSSGTLYGYTGGYGGNILQNRQEFMELQDSLSYEETILLMHSINPASRLTAIEYFTRNNFTKTAEIDQWIENNYMELPTVETMFGCLMETYDTRQLVYMYTNMTFK